jgi:hypothetical protein
MVSKSGMTRFSGLLVPKLHEAVMQDSVIGLELSQRSHCYQLIGSVNAVLLGSFGYKPKFKSNLRMTIISEALTKVGYPPYHGFPDFSANTYETDLPFDAVYNNLLPTLYLPVKSLTEFEYVVDDIIGKWETFLTPNSFSGPLSVDEAINGKLGFVGIDSMKLSVSAGYGHPGLKSDYIVGTKPFAKLERSMSDELDQLEAGLRDGVYVLPVWVGSLKDEPRKVGKLVRLFMSGQMSYVVLYRKYFLPIIHALQRHAMDTGIMWGLNPYGPAWDELFVRLMRYAHQWAGDYKKFDKRQLAEIVRVAALLLSLIAKRYCHYSDQEASIVFTLCYYLAYSVIVANGDVIWLRGSNPSGNVITTLLNSLVNIIMVVAVMKSLGVMFKDYLVFVMGDDSLLGHDSSVTQVQFKERILSMFDQIYTDPSSKDDNWVPEDTPRDSLSFLGRGFGVVYRSWDNGNMRLCPLRLESINKMLHFEPNSLDPYESLACRVGEAVMEMAQHDNYDELVHVLDVALLSLGLEWRKPTREYVLNSIYMGVYDKEFLSPINLH